LLQSLLNMVLEWFISFSTKQCKSQVRNTIRGAHGIFEKGGAREDHLARLL